MALVFSENSVTSDGERPEVGIGGRISTITLPEKNILRETYKYACLQKLFYFLNKGMILVCIVTTRNCNPDYPH